MSEELSKVLQPPTSLVCWFICLLPTFTIILWCCKPQINPSIGYSYTFQTSSLRAKEWCTLPILTLKKNDLTSWSAIVSVALWELKNLVPTQILHCQVLSMPAAKARAKTTGHRYFSSIFSSFSLIFQSHFKSSSQGKKKIAERVSWMEDGVLIPLKRSLWMHYAGTSWLSLHDSLSSGQSSLSSPSVDQRSGEKAFPLGILQK